MDTLKIDIVDVARIMDLRHAVIRHGMSPDSAQFEGDNEESAVHIAALDSDGRVVGCASLFDRPNEDQPAWQLRGMAVHPDVQHQGIGGQLLGFLEDYVKQRGDVLTLWCNAPARAVAFYQMHGWETVSQPFNISTIGPHRRLVKKL